MISVITPAHNEELFIKKCLCSVKTAAKEVSAEVEHIVVLNCCTDKTGEIASELGAKVITEESRNLSRIRNKGVVASKGDILITIDADSEMSSNMLSEVLGKLHSGKYIGGGAKIIPERISLGILCSLMVVAPFVLWHGVSAGMFWCMRKDYEAIGGFDEKLICIEDIDFGQRLRKYGKIQGKRYGTIGILSGTQWLFTEFLRETRNKRISFIMTQGRETQNKYIQPIAALRLMLSLCSI